MQQLQKSKHILWKACRNMELSCWKTFWKPMRHKYLKISQCHDENPFSKLHLIWLWINLKNIKIANMKVANIESLLLSWFRWLLNDNDLSFTLLNLKPMKLFMFIYLSVIMLLHGLWHLADPTADSNNGRILKDLEINRLFKLLFFTIL